MIRELRIYWRLKPYIKQLKGEFAMKLSWNMIIQVLATIAQALNVILDILPGKQKAIAATVIGVIQVIVARAGSLSNPDGTPAAAPYIKKG